ncbi:unnamed protein product (macronuclear) [Paramecium tetraurelia]|uniref:Uncharacterized protein n=1 Tax=Paramecium tetraurelia TaxID=5888 RepID=A0EFK1_PARTE|nr:uncharacterized protein GSPATT00026415001 [Paramecium tetraurelia]CAK94092.1 unnamed protein product [Paramecium tetraurelia]|eukprot:XP_001461465.1 hypothetical protein (macronuclear) [Paramecium tetraurelia strain d4-2]
MHYCLPEIVLLIKFKNLKHQDPHIIPSSRIRNTPQTQEQPNLKKRTISQIRRFGNPKQLAQNQHSDVLDFFELVEEQPLPVRNKKHTILEPLQSTPSPQMANAISPKRVSFNKQIQVKLISDDYVDSNEKRLQSRHILRRQMTDFIN